MGERSAVEEMRAALAASLGRRPELGHAAYELWVRAYLSCQVPGASMTPWSFVGSCTQAAWAAIEKQITEAEERGRREGYRACTEDVVAHYALSHDSVEIDDFVESVDLGAHIGAAERAKGSQ